LPKPAQLYVRQVSRVISYNVCCNASLEKLRAKQLKYGFLCMVCIIKNMRKNSKTQYKGLST